MTNTKKLVYIAFIASLISVLSYVSIPLPFSPVPVTGQTLAIILAGLLLDPKSAAASVGLWIAMAAIGLPVLSGGKAGLAAVLGPTGGYIFGFLVAAVVISLIRGKSQKIPQLVIAIVIGTIVIYAMGVTGLMLVTGMPLVAAITNGVLPFLIGDTLKAIIAVFVAIPLYRHLDIAR